MCACAGPLRVPPKEEHGDVTFGCGMFDCKITDPCSCLISEARISDSALGSRAMLWREAFDPPPPPYGAQVRRRPCAAPSLVRHARLPKTDSISEWRLARTTQVKEDILEGAQTMPPPSPPKRPETGTEQRGWFGTLGA